MTTRTSLPTVLTSPILQRSGEGVTFRVPNQSVAPNGSPRPGQSLVKSSPYVATATSAATPQFVPGGRITPTAKDFTPQTAAAPSRGGCVRGLKLGAILTLIFIFIAVYLVLYASKFNMVTDLVNGERVLNTNKLALWTLIIGSLLGIVLYVGYRAFY